MIIHCKSCSRKFVVRDQDIPDEGRTVKCGYCSVTWHQMPIFHETEIVEIQKINENSNENLSVEKIKASDGKIYKFLGSQWAQLLPSGKTGLFAKKKIGNELDKITGRKVPKVVKKKLKKNKEVDPSAEVMNETNKLPEIYKSKVGMGFFGYIFLIIIISFSGIGILKTFETDLINYSSRMEIVFLLLDEQLIYVSETIKNIIVIANDLLNTY